MSDAPCVDPFTIARHNMVETQLRARGIRDERVLAAMDRVPRHEFVPRESVHVAYEDHPVTIGESQTISQPYMVASMVEAAQLQPEDGVLEVGAGSGYQAAVLAELAAKVVAIERFPSLAKSAQERLIRLNYTNITVLTGDGSEGAPQFAPFNAIVVAAASPLVPQTLLDQLRQGGRLIIPIGSAEEQELQVIQMTASGPRADHRYKCKFVPLIGRYGFAPLNNP